MDSGKWEGRERGEAEKGREGRERGGTVCTVQLVTEICTIFLLLFNSSHVKHSTLHICEPTRAPMHKSHTHTHTCTHTCTHTHTYKYTYVHACTHTHFFVGKGTG